MSGATTVSVKSRYALTVVYDEQPGWPQLCHQDCLQLRRGVFNVCSVFGDLSPIRTAEGRYRWARARACIQLSPQYRCKHHQICIPQNAAFVDGCGWQGVRPESGACPSCGSTILREVKA